MAKAATPATTPTNFWPTAKTLAAPVKDEGAGFTVLGGALVTGVTGALPVAAAEELLPAG